MTLDEQIALDSLVKATQSSSAAAATSEILYLANFGPEAVRPLAQAFSDALGEHRRHALEVARDRNYWRKN